MSAGVTLGARVKARREELGLAQGDLPGVGRTTVTAIETGQVKSPGLDVAIKVAAGLGLTVDELAGAPASAVRMIPLAAIEADPDNPRTVDVADKVDADFVDSIKLQGLLQAITVRPIGLGRWRVAYGGRRYAALVHLNGPKSKVGVPCLTTELEGGPDLLLRQLVENIKRADMNPADLADAVTRLVDGNMDTAQLAAALGKGRRWVQEQASVGHHLTPAGKSALRAGTLNVSQAVALAAERDAGRQDDLAARAAVQGLGEEEIRAIIADNKAKEEAAAEAAAPALFAPPAPELTRIYSQANAEGVFDGKPAHRLRWKGRRGFFEISLFQFGKEKWTAGYKTEWRPSTMKNDGGRSSCAAGRDRYARSTAGMSFLVCALEHYRDMVERAKNHPEDGPAMRELHGWVADRLEALDAPRIAGEWRRNDLAPAAPAPKPAKAKAAPKVKELTKAEVCRLPKWGKALKFSYFVVFEEGQLALVKGWKAMAALLWEIYETAEPPQFWHSLLNRAAWANDSEGKPFDFGQLVVRVTKVKARP